VLLEISIVLVTQRQHHWQDSSGFDCRQKREIKQTDCKTIKKIQTVTYKEHFDIQEKYCPTE